VRVVSFVRPDGPRLGFVEGELVVDLTAVDPDAPRDLRKVLCAPARVGMSRDPQLWLKHGDVVEVEIEAVRTLVNRVKDEVAPLEKAAVRETHADS
jgi:hypothetical protein